MHRESLALRPSVWETLRRQHQQQQRASGVQGPKPGLVDPIRRWSRNGPPHRPHPGLYRPSPHAPSPFLPAPAPAHAVPVQQDGPADGRHTRRGGAGAAPAHRRTALLPAAAMQRAAGRRDQGGLGGQPDGQRRFGDMVHAAVGMTRTDLMLHVGAYRDCGRPSCFSAWRAGVPVTLCAVVASLAAGGHAVAGGPAVMTGCHAAAEPLRSQPPRHSTPRHLSACMGSGAQPRDGCSTAWAPRPREQRPFEVAPPPVWRRPTHALGPTTAGVPDTQPTPP